MMMMMLMVGLQTMTKTKETDEATQPDNNHKIVNMMGESEGSSQEDARRTGGDEAYRLSAGDRALFRLSRSPQRPFCYL
jgi:hypothetical protein